MKTISFKTKLMLLTCLLLNAVSYAQNSLNVINKNGTQVSFPLSSTKKLTFSAGNLVVTPISKNVVTFTLNYIENLNFKLVTITNMFEINAAIPVSIYPNPTEGDLLVESTEPILQINVLNVQGEKVIQIQPFHTTAQLHLGSDKKGIYLIQVLTPKGVSVYKIIKR